jgi:hypothetical protein
MKTRIVFSALLLSSATFAQQNKSAVLVPQQSPASVAATVVTVSTDSVRTNQPAATVQQNISMTMVPQMQLSNVAAAVVIDSTQNMQKSAVPAPAPAPAVIMLDGTRSTSPVPVKAKTVEATQGPQPK